MTFAQRLRELRERAGLTQESLALRCGMSIGAIRNYEQGVREPYWRGVFQLAHALGVDCSAFKDCVNVPSPDEAPLSSPAPTSAPPSSDRSETTAKAEPAKPRGRRRKMEGENKAAGDETKPAPRQRK